MPLSKPTKVPFWARTGTRIEPPEGKQDEGWLTGEKPPAQYMNHLQGFCGDWLGYFNERFADGLSGSTVFALLNPNDATRQLQTILGGGIKIDYGMNVGFDGAATPGALAVGDANLHLALVGGVAKLALDGVNDALTYDRAANRFVLAVAGSNRLALDVNGLRLGDGGLPTIPFEIVDSFAGVLEDAIGDYIDIMSIAHEVTESSAVLQYGYRHAAGATWETASTYIQNTIDGAFKGFVRLSGSQVASSAYNIGVHVGLGAASSRGGNASLFVDETAAYAHALLPRTYYGLAGDMSEIGSQTRPWSTIWLRGSTGTDAHVNATGSGGPGEMTLEVFEGATSRGSVKLIGHADLGSSRLDCRNVGYVSSLSMRARSGDPLDGYGYGLSNIFGASLFSGMYGSADGDALRFWRKNYRAAEFYGRSGNDDDVQFTLGHGSGINGTVADLRTYACICQDFLNGDTIPLERGDAVYILSTADHAVARVPAPVPTDTYIIGFVVDTSIAVGAIGRIATSGIVQMRTGNIAVARGTFVQGSATVAGRVVGAAFGPKTVGQALVAAGVQTYFKALIRFGG